MDALVQFLLDRLDDDATFMRAAIRLRESGAIVSSPEATEGAFALVEVIQNDPDTAQALTLFTYTGCRAPGEAERVLDEVESKRQIMECHEPWTADNGDTICGRCGREHIDGRPGGHFPCQTLRLLALPYAGHSDYNQAWRP